ncbi:MAG: 16S rRNA (adenine(1518)-N(6)/adenine(1519)-N(6))-dimethyltransferase RsmA [Betaproteobacteria bacterium]|nr:16S rRNA (adenine(1518)-N(6)/adenine(1519)-N(6))-dimethyltransferase RsmA [Betaproteobacteria bacterium]
MQHTARKRFGQHFLVDRHYIDRIVAAVDPRADDRLVEIGPGLGALTRPLLERVHHLTAVEIDRDIVAMLRGAFPQERLTVCDQDALTFDFAAVGDELRVVGNLPYNISSPLLFRLAAASARLRDMHFMLQQEVVERMAAAPATPAYGRLSVMLQYRFEVVPLFHVPPGAFRPPPKVESAVVRLLPLASRALAPRDESLLAELVRRAFGQRRKTLRNALKGLAGEDLLRGLGLDPAARAEVLPVAAFVAIANAAAEARLTPPSSG